MLLDDFLSEQEFFRGGVRELRAGPEAVEVADKEPFGGARAADLLDGDAAGRFPLQGGRLAGRPKRGHRESAAATKAELGESASAFFPIYGTQKAGRGEQSQRGIHLVLGEGR